MVNYGLYLNDKKIDLEFIGLKNSNNLEIIDKFTSEFKDQEELILYLVNKGLIHMDKNSKLNIRYYYQGKKTLPIVYANQSDYIRYDESEIGKLKYGVVNNINLPIYKEFISFMNDDVFLKKVNGYFSRYYNQRVNCSDLHHYLNHKKFGGTYCNETNLIGILNNMFLSAADFKVDQYGEVKIDYKTLRELGLFISKYKAKLQEQNLMDYDSTIIYNPTTGEYEKSYFKQLSLLKK